MYIPKAFEVNDHEKLVNFIRNNSFGILFSQAETEPQATHLPFIIDTNIGDKGALLSHMAKPNPHWNNLHDKEALVVFSGPHSYISASWYNESNTVPTWNYVAVHIYGTFKMIEDKEEMVDLIKNTVTFYESPFPNPWTADFDSSFIDGLMNGIVGFKILINKIEGKWKLNQNHSIERQHKVIKGLKTTNKYNSAEIAKLMEQNTRGKIETRLGRTSKVLNSLEE